MRTGKRLLPLLLAALPAVGPLHAQQPFTGSFHNLDVGVTAGTTGVGVSVSSMATDWLRLRAGFDFVPHFEYDMDFEIQVGDTPESKYDADGNRVETKFDRMAGYMYEITGLQIDDQVTMTGTPHFYNFQLIADFFPLRNKHWYVSAGIYSGSGTIGKAVNRTEEMTSLMAVAIYNNMYEKVVKEEEIFMGIELPPAISDKIIDAGRMGIHVGDYISDGSKYIMEPDQDNMVRATLEVNPVKPYLGAGYDGALSKRNDRLGLSVNCGILMWGGAPKVYTHDGTELTTQLTNIYGQVDDYVKIVRKFKVYPAINVAFTYRFDLIKQIR